MWDTQIPSLGWEGPLEKEWLPTPVFLPREFYGQRSLVGSSPWSHKDLDMTKVTDLTHTHAWSSRVFPNGSQVKIHLQCRRQRRRVFDSWVGKIPWRRKWQPTPVFLPGESHWQRSLVGYNPKVSKNRTRLSDWARTYMTKLASQA